MIKNKYLLTLVLLSAVFFAIFLTLRVFQFQSFFSYEWEDDARENQVVYNIATANIPYQTIFQTNPPKFLNNHFSPIYYIIAIFYKLYPHIYMWFFLICITYAFSSLLVYGIADKFLKDKLLSFLVAVIFLVYPPLHYATLGSLDPNNFLLPLFLLVFFFLYRMNFVAYIVFMILACFCKEDVPLYFLGFGIYQIYKKYPKKWWLTTLIFSSLYFLVSVYITIKYSKLDTVGIGDFDHISIVNLRKTR